MQQSTLLRLSSTAVRQFYRRHHVRINKCRQIHSTGALRAAWPHPENDKSARLPQQRTDSKPTRLQKFITDRPALHKAIFDVARALRIVTPRSMAQDRVFKMYETLIATRPDEEAHFWRHSCHLPPTFQSWFTITNLHIWLWMTRFRSLPKEKAVLFSQPLIDAFFDDVEYRLRALLQPGLCLPSPHSPPTSYYPVPDQMADRQAKKRQAPEKLLRRQMHHYREQFFGMGLSFDLGLARDDSDLAGAIWRNFLGCRGAQGIQYPSPDPLNPTPFRFHRALNVSGSKADEKLASLTEVEIGRMEATDDGSGVYDHRPEESDYYVDYPETILALTTYIRSEVDRLASLPDDVVVSTLLPGALWDHLEDIRFGPITKNL